ncbi:MAG: PIG-L deacetylase family protein [Hyphomicrobiaceae bacterium]
MMPLLLPPPGRSLTILCLGAHSDDIEIGAGATVMGLIAAGVEVDVTWCVASAIGPRYDEAMAGAEAVLSGAARRQVDCQRFRDGFFPYQGAEVKAWIESLKARVTPDIIFTHRREDAHQDHREICRLTWNAFRDHLILEYEIPKWDGDLGQPNFYIPMRSAMLERKVDVLERVFGTQRSKDWFDAETFRGLARLRGMECRAPERYAEAFFARKVCAGPAVRASESPQL